jgi:hypothetical protein
MGTVQRNGAIQPNNNRPQLPPGGTNGDARACDPNAVADAVIAKQRGDHYRKLLQASADAIIRKEGSAIAKIADRSPEEIRAWADKFYKEHGAFVSDVLQVNERQGRSYAETQREKLMCSIADDCLSQLLRDMDKKRGQIVLDAIGLKIAQAGQVGN